LHYKHQEFGWFYDLIFRSVPWLWQQDRYQEGRYASGVAEPRTSPQVIGKAQLFRK